MKTTEKSAIELLGISTIIMMLAYLSEIIIMQVIRVSLYLLSVPTAAVSSAISATDAEYIVSAIYAVPAAIWFIYNLYIMHLESAGKISL